MSRAANRKFLLLSMLTLAACHPPMPGPPPNAQAASDLNPSGRPANGPALYQPYGPPNGTNAFSPLTCTPQGPGVTCTRHDEAPAGG